MLLLLQRGVFAGGGGGGGGLDDQARRRVEGSSGIGKLLLLLWSFHLVASSFPLQLLASGSTTDAAHARNLATPLASPPQRRRGSTHTTPILSPLWVLHPQLHERHDFHESVNSPWDIVTHVVVVVVVVVCTCPQWVGLLLKRGGRRRARGGCRRPMCVDGIRRFASRRRSPCC